jgi:dephospho-CoA kinase
MKKIGITGNIGSGKTFVSKLFSQLLNIPVFYSDLEVRILMNQNKELKKEIINLFGKESYKIDGSLNRDYLIQKFFIGSDSDTHNKEVERLIRPYLYKVFKEWCLKEKGSSYCLFESAIIFEHKAEKEFDFIITVIAPFDIRLERVKERDPFRSDIEIENIMMKQFEQGEKASRSNFIIINNNQLSLERQIRKIHSDLLI